MQKKPMTLFTAELLIIFSVLLVLKTSDIWQTLDVCPKFFFWNTIEYTKKNVVRNPIS